MAPSPSVKDKFLSTVFKILCDWASFCYFFAALSLIQQQWTPCYFLNSADMLPTALPVPLTGTLFFPHLQQVFFQMSPAQTHPDYPIPSAMRTPYSPPLPSSRAPSNTLTTYLLLCLLIFTRQRSLKSALFTGVAQGQRLVRST